MGRFVFKLPDVGEGTAEAEIVKWHVKAGDAVGEDQPLVDIMTDKATVEIVSPVTGRIVSRKGEEGTKAAVGSELVVFEVEGSEAERPERAPPTPPKGEGDKERVTASKEEGGRAGARGLASPAVKARAKALGIDLSTISGSGPGSTVQHADLDKILLSRQPAQPGPSRPVIAAKEEGAEDIKIFGLRRRIAERMLDSKRRIPHFTYVEEVDVTELEERRAALNAKASSRLTMLPFLIRAMVRAIAKHPVVNAHFDDEQGVIRRFSAIHVGIATQTERGLLVPVVRDAGSKDMQALAVEIARLAEGARAGKSNPKELSGSTITVTSLGALGGVAATPIINPPEVAIVGVNRLAERPMVKNGAIVIRKMMNLSSSFDHRIVDGYEAATFIKTVKEYLETPESG